MNWVDLVIILLLAYFAAEAVGRSLFVEVLDLVSFLLALILSFRFYSLAGKFLQSSFDLPRSLSLAIGFMIVWFLSETIFYTIARLSLHRLRPIPVKGKRFLAIIPATLRGLIFISLILVFLSTFPLQPRIKKSIDNSTLGNIILKQAYRLEDPVKEVFGGVTQDSLTFLTIKPETNESVNLGFQTKEYKINDGDETTMIDLVNNERTSRGFKALTFDPRLREIARAHSQDMFERGYFSHYTPEGESVADRAQKAGIDYQVIGENLAFAPSLDLAHKGLMNSPGHRANILSPDFNKIGIGVIDGGIYGLMITQVFSN